MLFKPLNRRLPALMTVLGIGMGLVVALMVGVAAAQEPRPAEPPPGVTLRTAASQTYFLILNTARPLEEVMPPLLARLAELKNGGVIEDFGVQPERSAPGAVPGVRVASSAPAEGLARLRLPGVLDVLPHLPSPPPAVEIGALAVTGIVTGQVRDAVTNAPVAFDAASHMADIEVFDAVSFAYLGCVRYNTNISQSCDQDADVNGVYSITVTAPYTRVKLAAWAWSNDGAAYYAHEMYNNKIFFSQANPVTLTEGAVASNTNFLMDRAGAISGTVKLVTGLPVRDVSVRLFDAAGNATEWDYTDEDGQFLIAGQRAGAYRVYLYDGPEPYIVPEWYQDRTSLAEATPITVTGGMTANIVATVAFTDEPISVYGGVTFWVNDEVTGKPLAGVIVSAHPIADPTNLQDSCATSTDGSCDLWLPVGEYYVRFARIGHESEYYNNRTGVAGMAAAPGAADPLSVTPAHINVAATLARATARITGTVTYQGAPLAADQRAMVMMVIPYGSSGYLSLCDEYGWGYYLPICPLITGTGSTAVYSIPLSAGTYQVRFIVQQDDSMGGWAYQDSEWYNDKPNSIAANVFTLTTGTTMPNINADIGQLAYYGCVTGTVKYSATGVESQVTLYADRNAAWWYSTFQTNPDGSYQACDVPPGRYLVSFSRFPSATTWYRDAASSAPTTALATSVTVTSAAATTNVNGYLGGLGACISGKFVDASGQPASGAQFWLWDASDNTRMGFWHGLYGAWWDLSLAGTADRDGGFVACGLSPGVYRLEARSWQVGAGGVFGSSEAVTVAAGQTRDIGVIVLESSRVYMPIIRRQ